MENIINLGIPHIGEKIFRSIDTPGLIKCLEVSQTWFDLAGNVFLKRLRVKMLEACQSGKTKVVQLLLERCDSEENGLNTKDEEGWTPFMEACFHGHKDIVKLLLEHFDLNIDLNARNNGDYGWTPFMWACWNGHKDVVKLLLDQYKRIELNARDNDGGTAFMLACYKGHKDVVHLLLDYPEFSTQTPLQKKHTANTDNPGEAHAPDPRESQEEDEEEDTAKLVYTCNSCSKSEETRYHCTICNDFGLCIACFQWRSSTSTDSDRPAAIQQCVPILVHASKCRNANCGSASCKKMKRVESHVSKCKRNSTGGCRICKKIKQKLRMQQLKQRLQEAAMMRQRMAQMEAPQKPRQQMLAQVRSPPNIPNIDLNARTNDRLTALMVACGLGHRDVVKLLLDYSDHNIELNARSNTGVTAFMLACREGQKDVVKLLLDYDRNIELNARSNAGWTGLTIACRNGHKDVVKLLLEHLDIIEMNATNKYGSTAFMTACQNGHKDVVQLLLDHSYSNIGLNAQRSSGRKDVVQFNRGLTAIMFALIMACQEGHKDVVKLLLDHSEKFDLNAKDIDGNTALMIASQKGHQDIVQLIKAKLNM